MKRLFSLLLCPLLFLSVAMAGVNTVTVNRDGSGDFTSLQAAINSVRVFAPDSTIILLKNGVYNEKIVIPATLHKIAIVGEDAERTIVRCNDYALRDNMATFKTYTMLIQGYEITLENLTVENFAGSRGVGQAVALHAEGDRLVFRNCRFIGNQDTIYTGGRTSRQYYLDCYVEGTTDYIFGAAICFFENCELKSKGSSYLTAASTYAEIPYGYVFYKCKLVGDGSEGQQVFLGRPWRPYSATAFIECEMGAHIRPEGWDNWRDPANEKTARYAEYNNTGPGASTAGRVGWSRQLTASEASEYGIENVFRVNDFWLPVK